MTGSQGGSEWVVTELPYNPTLQSGGFGPIGYSAASSRDAGTEPCKQRTRLVERSKMMGYMGIMENGRDYRDYIRLYRVYYIGMILKSSSLRCWTCFDDFDVSFLLRQDDNSQFYSDRVSKHCPVYTHTQIHPHRRQS